MAREGEEQSVDEELYSRQLYVLGHMATSKLATSRVLISGLGGLGVEIAKDIILSGVKSVTLHDTREATLGDLTSQFFLTRDDLGKNRASACCTRLADLNPHVSVTFSSRPLTPDFLLTFKVVVLTDSNLEEQLTVSDVCHDQDISLIVASTKGLFGQLFCDFGRKFEVLDPTGREPVSFLVESITKEEEGVVTLPAKTFHRLQDGDLVTFSKVRGMTQLNQTRPHTIKYNGVTWTPWDRFEVEGDMTLQEFFQYFLQHHELRVTMVSAGDHTIHSFMLPRHERRRRTLMKITSILKEVMMVGEGEDAGKSAGVPQDHSLGPVLMLDICADDKDGMDVDVPHVRYTVRRDS